MTKVIITIHRDSVFFECESHAEDHDTCTIVSTLCNVLAVQSYPQVYEPGLVKIVDNSPSEATKAVFTAVEKVLREAAKQNPEYLKVY